MRLWQVWEAQGGGVSLLLFSPLFSPQFSPQISHILSDLPYSLRSPIFSLIPAVFTLIPAVFTLIPAEVQERLRSKNG